MAENKADALKQAKNQYQLKIYYTGETPENYMEKTVQLDVLCRKHVPWLVKFYTKDGVCHQFVNSLGAYRKISQDIGQILDAVIVNNKQREAVDRIIDKMLLDYLGQDWANENDSIIDPCEY